MTYFSNTLFGKGEKSSKMTEEQGELARAMLHEMFGGLAVVKLREEAVHCAALSPVHEVAKKMLVYGSKPQRKGHHACA